MEEMSAGGTDLEHTASQWIRTPLAPVNVPPERPPIIPPSTAEKRTPTAPPATPDDLDVGCPSLCCAGCSHGFGTLPHKSVGSEKRPLILTERIAAGLHSRFLQICTWVCCVIICDLPSSSDTYILSIVYSTVPSEIASTLLKSQLSNQNNQERICSSMPFPFPDLDMHRIQSQFSRRKSTGRYMRGTDLVVVGLSKTRIRIKIQRIYFEAEGCRTLGPS